MVSCSPLVRSIPVLMPMSSLDQLANLMQQCMPGGLVVERSGRFPKGWAFIWFHVLFSACGSQACLWLSLLSFFSYLDQRAPSKILHCLLPTSKLVLLISCGLRNQTVKILKSKIFSPSLTLRLAMRSFVLRVYAVPATSRMFPLPCARVRSWV